MVDRFRIRVFQGKRCLVESRDASEGEAAMAMETVRSKNGWGFLALITPEKSLG